MLLKLLNYLTDSANRNLFQVFMFHKNCIICKQNAKLNNFNRLVNNINSEKKIGVRGCCKCYIILGDGFQKSYTVLSYRVGVVKNFQFLRYIICARSLGAS